MLRFQSEQFDKKAGIEGVILAGENRGKMLLKLLNSQI